ncbi:uncharacterized protein BDW47DRAFT_113327 [Aspergillus candidus]|uniref:Uncharacterized protein n=1 Tax=Aspergillus candidus TaxID=41067 RepID=A0A2I2EZQ3_ASPCN|nr:hypothetical protein BDW47DRAFT_113327 [Aspergillus candidus]PLB33846.1 hypothetical protein BDW47DRAFT_113327 [Aspergillus candidus]
MEWASHLLASGPHLSSLTLEATNALLSPLGSHLRRCSAMMREKDGCKKDGERRPASFLCAPWLTQPAVPLRAR